MIHTLEMKDSHWQAMRSHVSDAAPLEACGLLAGKDARVEKVFNMRNQAQSPVKFRLDPLEQLNVFEWIDDNGLDLLGIFHSHPAGPETVSATDIAESAYEVVHVIWARTEDNWNARGFWIESGEAKEVKLQILGE